MSGPAPGAARFRLRLEREGQGLWWDQQRYLAALRALVRRAGLEPRADGAYITGAPVSPPGCASRYEFAELSLGRPCTCAHLLAQLGKTLVSGLRLLSAVRVPAWGPEIRKAVQARCFEVTCPAATPACAERFLASDAWPWTRWKRGQERALDVRAAVPEMICLSERVRFTLECADTAPRPAEVMASVFHLPLAETLLLPTACTGVRMTAQPVDGGMARA